MAEHDSEPTRELISSLVRDARELLEDEVALARAEIQDNITAGRSIGIAFSAAAVLALVGLVLVCTAAANAVADAFGFPAWAAYGVTALLLVVAAWILLSVGKRRLSTIGVLPKTRRSLRENVQWIRSKSNSR